MTAPLIHRLRSFQKTPVTLMSRVRGEDGNYITQAGVDAISWKVYDGSTLVTSGTLPKADVVFDVLQVDKRWTADRVGYNFRWVATGNAFPEAGKSYRIEVMVTPTGGEAFPLVWINDTIDLQGTVG